MLDNEYIFTSKSENSLASGSFSWKAPSNIALVKYWGKHGEQLPKNTSISFTLDACHTLTTLEFKKRQSVKKEIQGENGQVFTESFIDLNVLLDGEEKPEFVPKIVQFISRIAPFSPFILDYDLTIKTHNSFPHSSGIASSASSMAALALCIMSLEKALNPELSEELFFRKASLLARLGSGSAARSVQGDLVVWGAHPMIEGSSDLFGLHYQDKVHDVFKSYHDTILLVDKGEKQVSSTVGHNLMHDHPFAQQRFQQANSHIVSLTKALENGDLDSFIRIVELEALSLHAMMMTSKPYFMLMKPNTLSIIHKVWEFRKSTGSHLCFTLDAGANVHLLFPAQEKTQVNDFIVNELLQFCQNNHYICDRVGNGAKPMHQQELTH